MLSAAVPEQVLWLAHSSKNAPVQSRFKSYFSDWPTARQRIPYTLMQEMRITPDLPGYTELVEQIFFAIMDSKLDTPEAARAYLEPYSPPAPPPPVNLRRRAVKRETKPAKPRSKKAAAPVSEDLNTVSAEAAESSESPTAESAKTLMGKPPKPTRTLAVAAKAVAPSVKGSAAKAPLLKKSAAKPAPAVAKKTVPAKSLTKATPSRTASKTSVKQQPAASLNPPQSLNPQISWLARKLR